MTYERNVKRESPRDKCIIFFRDEGFYPTQYPANYEDWQAEADRNPGTRKIMDAATGDVLWEPPSTLQAWRV